MTYRYHLFAGLYYYPAGGMSDYVGRFKTVDDARRAFEDSRFEWAEIAQLVGSRLMPIEAGYRMIDQGGAVDWQQV